MLFKSYILEKNLEPLNLLKMVLFYGENYGLKKEFKEKIKKENKNCEMLNLLQEDITKNKSILINEIVNKSLFDKKKIIFIDQVTDKILPILEEIVDNIEDEKIYVFSEILDKRSKLRNYFEKTKFFGTVPCYQDNEITIKKLIISKLDGFIGVSPQVINSIVENTGLDRNKIINEIEKIKHYFHDKKIQDNKIDLLLNLRTNNDFNLLRDEAIKGNKINTNKLLSDTVFEPENHIYFLNLINQRINKLNEIEKIKNKAINIEAAIAELKPSVFWKDKPILIEQSKKWNEKKIQLALQKTFNTEIEIKSNSSVNKELLIKHLLIEICSTASSF